MHVKVAGRPAYSTSIYHGTWFSEKIIMILTRTHQDLIILLLVLICSVGLAGASVKIVPIGDSITCGSISNDDGQDHPTYRFWLWQHLQESGYDVDFVGSSDQTHLPFSFDQDNEAHPGYRASDLLTDDRLKHWLSGYNPDIALVQLGTNDVRTGVPMEKTISSLDQIIDVLREKNPQIVILMGTVIPREGSIERQQILNHAIEGLAGTKSTAASPVVAVDQFSGYDGDADSQPPIYLHPNEQGEQKIADRYYAALVPYLSTDRKEAGAIVTPAPAPTSTLQTTPRPTQDLESVNVVLRTPAPATMQVQTPGAWSPIGGGQKQYLIGNSSFQSLVQSGWQAGWTPALQSSGIMTMAMENQRQQTPEPPVELFIRWYPARG